MPCWGWRGCGPYSRGGETPAEVIEVRKQNYLEFKFRCVFLGANVKQNSMENFDIIIARSQELETSITILCGK